MLVQGVLLAALLAILSHGLFAQVLSRASVYKIGVSRTTGTHAVGSAVLIAPGKLITNCHTVRDAERIGIIYPEGEIPVSLDQADFFHDLCAYPIPPGVPGLEKYGGLTRAQHIHISVMPFLQVPVTTQLYFKDDPNRPGDPWAGHKPQLALNPRSDGKYLKADFDFVLGSGL